MSVNLSAQQTKGLSELWKRLRFVLLAVIIYRIGTHIPIPGIDPNKLASIFQQNQGTLLDLFNMFSGGALERMSIMALNIMPYITASIIMSLMEGTNPALKKKFREEGEEGRRIRTAYVRYGTVALAFFTSKRLSIRITESRSCFRAWTNFPTYSCCFPCNRNSFSYVVRGAGY